MRRIVFPLGRPYVVPSDRLGHEVARLLVEPSPLRRQHHQMAGDAAMLFHRLDTSDHRLALEQHAGAASEGAVIHRFMHSRGPVANVVQLDVHQATFDRQVQQALTEIAREHLREQGQHVKTHGDPRSSLFRGGCFFRRGFRGRSGLLGILHDVSSGKGCVSGRPLSAASLSSERNLGGPGGACNRAAPAARLQRCHAACQEPGAGGRVDEDLDRAELRAKNYVRADAFPYTNAVGATYDSGTYASNMALSMRIADWDGFTARKADAQRRGRLLGLGLAPYVESSIGSPRERTDIIVKPTVVDVVIGTQPSGQGHETSFAQVAADLMGLPFEKVQIVIGDTDIVSAGGGSHSGRSMRHAATVLSVGVPQLIEKAKQAAAKILECKPEEIEWSAGRLSAPGSNVTFNLLELAREAEARGLPRLEVRTDNEMHDPVFPNGCAICEVEVDPETGEVHIDRLTAVADCGTVVNPRLLAGQVHGGIVHGLGNALSEEAVYDEETGQLLTGTLMDYALPRADNVPNFTVETIVTPSPNNFLGFKGIGELPTNGAPAALANAVLDALAPLGVRHLDMPLTAHKIWQALNAS